MVRQLLDYLSQGWFVYNVLSQYLTYVSTFRYLNVPFLISRARFDRIRLVETFEQKHYLFYVTNSDIK